MPGGGSGRDVSQGPVRTASVRVVAYGLVGFLVALLLMSAIATLVVQLQLDSAQNSLRARWLPAQRAANALYESYVQEEAGLGGYLLTADHLLLESYDRGQRSAARARSKLVSLLEADPAATAKLARVTSAFEKWSTEAAHPGIAARRRGPIGGAELDAMASRDNQLFIAVRHELDGLDGRTRALVTSELNQISNAQLAANVVIAVSGVLALCVAVVAVPVLRRMLTRPLTRLVGQVRRVAGGHSDESIQPGGPAEFALIGAAVERMRQSMVEESRALVSLQRELARRGERDRLAADLHDLSIQRLYALGLSMSAVGHRNPGWRDDLDPLIEETDRTIREMRGIVFGLNVDQEPEDARAAIQQLVEDSSRALGFEPRIVVRGSLGGLAPGMTADLLAVLREALSNVARHAGASRTDIVVTVDDGSLSLKVSDDGRGLPGQRGSGTGVANIEARAAHHGGRSSVMGSPGSGTTVEWVVPVSSGAVDRGDAATLEIREAPP